MRGKSTVPKDALVNIILRSLREEYIRNELSLGPNVNLASRINSLNKNDLVGLLKGTEEGAQLLAELEDKYPLPGSPTLYLVISRNLAPAEQIIERTYEVANDNECVLSFSSSKTIRRVYNTERARILNLGPDIIEIPVFYERRIDYTSTDLETWGEDLTIYDLRRAFIWISHAYNHGLIACSDYSGINPITTWANSFLNIRLDLPNIPIDMFHRLAEGGTPRTATFAITELALQPFLDIQSLTVYDQELESSDTFRQLQFQDNDWEQTAGYFSRHPVIPVGGLGIARRYGRIWTPTHIPKDQLLNSATNLISRTEAALSEKLNANDKSFLDHFSNISVQISGRTITSEARKVFDDIAWALFRLNKKHNHQELIDNELVTKIIEYIDILGFTTTVEAECDQCGAVLVKCPICSSPYEAIVQNNDIKIVCPLHREQMLNGDDEYKCECGQGINLILPNNIKIYPGLSTILAFRDFISENDLKYDGWFVIDGNLIRSYTSPKSRSCEYHLSELNKWRLRAHIHVTGPISKKREKLIKSIITNVKEKCSKNDWHPNHEMCSECHGGEVFATNITSENMCLPRLMGFAIDENFDGIHHRFEQADIKYRDNLITEENREVSIGIHLKSRENDPPKRGVGQSSSGIKGLYAQLFFTIHKRLIGEGVFDLIGISIPNKIFNETRDAFTGISKELNVPILVLDEENWMSIIAAALDNIENG